MGLYQYTSTIPVVNASRSIISTTTSSLERFQGAAFVPEVDWSIDWTYVGLRFGINTPILLSENNNPVTVLPAPAFSAGLYGKW